MLIGVEGNI